MLNSPPTEREKLIFAYIDGFEYAKILTKEIEIEKLIQQAAWKADRLLHPGTIIAYCGGQEFPPSRISAPPDLLTWPTKIRKRYLISGYNSASRERDMLTDNLTETFGS